MAKSKYTGPYNAPSVRGAAGGLSIPSAPTDTQHSGDITQQDTPPASDKIILSAYLSAALGAPNVTGDGTNYKIPFDTVLKNQGATYDPLTGIVTINKAGIYKFEVTISFNTGGSAKTSVALEIVLPRGPTFPDALFGFLDIYIDTTAGINQSRSLSSPPVALQPGDQAYIIFLISGGAKDSDLWGTNGGIAQTYFAMYSL